MKAAEKAQAIKDLILDRMAVEVTIDPEDVEGITDIDDFERSVDVERAINEQSEIVFYDRAMKYLSAEDPSLQEALELADEYGYRPKDLSSEILATILNEQKTREIYYDLRDEIEDILQEEDDDEEVDGVGLVSDLSARYDSRSSFYGKALIDESNDGTILTLISYDTPVATFDRTTGILDVFGYYSKTTARHIREFAKQLGIELPNGKDIKGRYQS